MKSRRRLARIFNGISIGCFFFSSLTMILLPLSERMEHPIMAYIPGIVFWSGLVGGILFYLLSVWRLKKSESYQKFAQERRIGALSPGATPEGLIADILFIPSAAVSIAGTFFLHIPDVLMIGSMWIAILSLYGHFVLNGKAYKFLYQRRRKRRVERRSEKESDTVR